MKFLILPAPSVSSQHQLGAPLSSLCLPLHIILEKLNREINFKCNLKFKMHNVQKDTSSSFSGVKTISQLFFFFSFISNKNRLCLLPSFNTSEEFGLLLFTAGRASRGKEERSEWSLWSSLLYWPPLNIVKKNTSLPSVLTWNNTSLFSLEIRK